MNSSEEKMDWEQLRAAAADLRHSKRLRQREIAQALGISEGELVAAHVQADAIRQIESGAAGVRALRLRPDWGQMLAAMEALGEVMALTRNASCVHEKYGVYRNFSQQGQVGMVLGGAIDLRLFFQHWRQGFAVFDASGKDLQLSLQWFDAYGNAVHKVFLRPASEVQAYWQLVAEFTASVQEQSWGEPLEVALAAPALPEVNPVEFRAAWSAMQDTHEFFALLKKFRLSRLQGLQLAGAGFAQQVQADGVLPLLQNAAAQDLPLMVFVGSLGVIQIHSGPLHRIVPMGPWLNVLDPDFNLHLRQDLIDSAWIVKKPSVDGEISSLELFTAEGELIAMLFGVRKQGQREQEGWRQLLASMPMQKLACAA